MQFTLQSSYPWLMERIIFLTRAGSMAYGTDTPDSDVDIRGIAIPPISHFFGIEEPFSQAQQTEPDIVVWSLQRFIKLAKSANPSILEVLFTEPEDHISVHPIGAKLIENRDLFVSQMVAQTFLGYGNQKLHELKRSKDSGSLGPISGPLTKREQRILDHGYDTKDAMHLVRLLRMGKEILSGKGVIVRRPDAAELLSIRKGDWPYEDLLAWASVNIDEIKAILKKSPLPPTADDKKINRLCVDLVQSSFAHEINLPVMATGFSKMPWTFQSGVLLTKKLSETEEAT